jgi:hypothetical protein
MNKRAVPYQVIVFLVYLSLQVFLFDNMVLFRSAFCFVYLGFILLLPLQISHTLLIAVSFLAGLVVDMFYSTPGINASATVLTGFLRPYWLGLITPRGGYEEIDIPRLKSLGFSWFITFAAPLIFIHHLSLFIVEAGDLFNFWFVLNKTFFSTIYTTGILVIGQYMFYARVRYV